MKNGREFVDPKLVAKIEAQEEKDGINLTSIPTGSEVTFETLNSVYKLEKAEGRLWLLTGGTRWIGEKAKTLVIVVGSTFGGSMIRPDWIGEGMRVEIYEKATGKTVSTSPVVNMWEARCN